ncbi:hypothetical protein ACFVVL_03485 [Kitasatospora sp. NPDC058115]|uniref:hypothetical protein n=1 Tax=Kitasatospora sp. NPDC058115 TaxID=3346347 RepID=UPI0036D7C748
MIGLVPGRAVGAAAAGLKCRPGSDAVDGVGVHAVGGAVGSTPIGFLATGHVGSRRRPA